MGSRLEYWGALRRGSGVVSLGGEALRIELAEEGARVIYVELLLLSGVERGGMVASVVSAASETSRVEEALDDGVCTRLEEEEEGGLFLGIATEVLAKDERGAWFNP